MDGSASPIWSPPFLPYACPKDIPGTLALGEAIRAVVSPGDLMVAAGSGAVILAFFAAVAGHSMSTRRGRPPLTDVLRLNLRRDRLEDRTEGDSTVASNAN